MRSAELLLAVALLAASTTSVRAEPVDAAIGPSPTPQQVQEATEAVYSDPDLHGLKAERVLRFRDREREDPPEAGADLRWLRELMRWLSEAGRWLMWLGMATLAAVVIVRLWRWVQLRGATAPSGALTLPSHVRDLDIRPESLPADVPGAVRVLWQRGQTREALSLLYRGALSRLVHEHDVPVRASSTEGECATLASRHLGTESGAFVARLIGLWQLAVYGARLPEDEAVLAVCDEYEAQLALRVAAKQALTGATA